MRLILPTHASGSTVASRRHRSHGVSIVVACHRARTRAGAHRRRPCRSRPPPTEPAAEPTTSADAKQAWLDAAQKAEAVNELVLQAKIAEKEATAKVAKTAAATVTTKRAEGGRRRRAARSRPTPRVASYQARIDDFTNASFRGARLSQVSLLLTANSADDFLDSATTLDRVAADTQQTLDEALAARTAAKPPRGPSATAASQAADAAQARR